jgi:DNA-binding transcriptional LysR family regulator
MEQMDTELNINLLRIFHVAAEEESFTRAAERLHLTQPGISKHIKGLEEYFSTPLFDRLGRKSSLTQAGSILHEATHRIFQIIDDSKKTIDDLGCGTLAQLRIGASITLGIYILLPYVKQFRAHFPNADISVNISVSRKVEEDVLNNRLDLGFIGAPSNNAMLVAGKLLDDELVLILPADHPWSRRKTVSIREINHKPFIISQPGSGTRTILEDRFRKIQITPRFIELGHTESVKRAVEAGLGISILSKAVVERELKQGWLKTAKLQGINLERRFFYIHRKGKYISKTANAFLSLIVRAI